LRVIFLSNDQKVMLPTRTSFVFRKEKRKEKYKSYYSSHA
jgi:hypothetical protein